MINFFNKEILLVKFPIIFPLFYGLVLYLFPKYETFLILITIFLLAETHFAATWPFFLNKTNYPHILKNKTSLVLSPILLILFCAIGFFYFKYFFLLLFFAANVYHVTRQSYGVMSLYVQNIQEKKYYEIGLYIFNIIFFLVAFFRFYKPLINNENLIILNFIIILSMILTFVYLLLKYKFSENFLTFVTGVLIFYPVCFVANPVHAIIMGVTMHYTQYLFFTNKVDVARNNEKINFKKRSFLNFRFWVILFIYSLIMTYFSLMGKVGSEHFQNLIIIPITGQMLHFYLDSQLWKFSESHNRDHTLKYIKN
tara:strand:- start:1817 stop:2749 length:933 start_codon:yes stop_codon:yes gene_type:complete